LSSSSDVQELGIDIGGIYGVHGEVRNAYKMLVVKHQGPLMRRKRTREDDIKIDREV